MAGRKPGHLFLGAFFCRLSFCPVIPGRGRQAANPRMDLCWAVPNVGTHSAHSRVSGNPVLQTQAMGPRRSLPLRRRGRAGRIAHIQLSNSIARSLGRASSPVFFVGAGSAVVSLVPRQIEGDGAPGGATIVRSVPRSLSRTRAPHGAPSRASSVQRRAALCGSRPFLPPGFAHWRRRRRAVPAPDWPCSWRAARIGRRAEPRRRPSAEGA